MIKSGLIQKVADKMGLTKKDALVIVDSLLNSMTEALARNDKIGIRGLGSLRVRQRRARIGRNPKTGEKVQVPAKRVAYFNMGKELSEKL